MERINSEIEIITRHTAVTGKTIVDVGCGTGKLARELTKLGASVIGFDTPELIEKATKIGKEGTEEFKVGYGQDMPVESDFADIVIFFASFHHVPQNEMENALKESCRIAKKGGRILFVEPVCVDGSYTELTKLADDEFEIQKAAFEYIFKASAGNPLGNGIEKFYYLERTFEDYKKLITLYITDEVRREEVMQKAYGRIIELGLSPINAVFKAIVRFNMFTKT